MTKARKSSPKKKAPTRKGPKQSPAASAVARHRARMRRAGMRLVQLWVPDSRSPTFLAEARRQSLLASHDVKGEREIMDWIESANRDLDLGE